MLLHSSASVGSACENRVKNEKLQPWERTEQVCAVCGIEKPMAEFYDNLNWKTGKESKCKACHRSYSRAYKRGWLAGRKAKPSS